MAMPEITLDLMCDLDEEELHDRALQMSSCSLRIDDVESAKKDANKEFGEQLSSLRGEVRRLANVIRSRRERRPVACAVTFHSPAQGSKRIVRKDTGEFVRDEPMSLYEMQENLFAHSPNSAEESTDEPADIPAGEDQETEQKPTEAS